MEMNYEKNIEETLFFSRESHTQKLNGSVVKKKQ
jgi:hypothetical protein